MDGLKLELVLALEILGRGIAGVLGPGHPDLSDVEGVENLGGVVEPGDVVPMFMGRHQGLKFALGFGGDAFRHPEDFLAAVRGAAQDAAVDENMVGAAIAVKGEEEAIAQPLAIHADAHLAAAGNFWGRSYGHLDHPP